MKKLAGVYPETSASRLKRAVVEGQVTVNGRRVDDPGAFVNEKDTVAWDENARVQRRIESSLTVLFEDDDLVVVVKPAGLLTHPTEAKEKDTLQSRVSGYIAHKKKTRGYVSVVHRLDKDTSGALSFALSKRGMVLLQAQLRAHTLDRRYLAVVEGAMKGESGTFSRDLVEDRGDLRRGVAKTGEKGLSAVTRWKVVERFGTLATLVEARLETGRTHQVRLHFNHAGHPLVGEKVYRDPKKPPFPIDCPRQALHAGLLGWVGHDGVARKVEVPLPADFEKLLYELRRRTAKR